MADKAVLIDFAIAQHFAADSGASVGKIHSTNQGMIQIFGSDGNDESGPYSPTSTPREEDSRRQYV